LQRFFGHQSQLQARTAHAPVISQLVGPVRGQPVKGLRDKAAAGRRLCHGGFELSVQKLRIWQDHLGRDPLGRQAKCRAAQGSQNLDQVGRLNRRVAHLDPAPRGAVQQRDNAKAQIKGE